MKRKHILLLVSSVLLFFIGAGLLSQSAQIYERQRAITVATRHVENSFPRSMIYLKTESPLDRYDYSWRVHFSPADDPDFTFYVEIVKSSLFPFSEMELYLDSYYEQKFQDELDDVHLPMIQELWGENVVVYVLLTENTVYKYGIPALSDNTTFQEAFPYFENGYDINIFLPYSYTPSAENEGVEAEKIFSFLQYLQTCPSKPLCINMQWEYNQEEESSAFYSFYTGEEFTTSQEIGEELYWAFRYEE